MELLATDTALGEMVSSLGGGSSGVPIGTIIVWSAKTVLPDPETEGVWLECNGDTFDTSTYPRLAEVL